MAFSQAFARNRNSERVDAVVGRKTGSLPDYENGVLPAPGNDSFSAVDPDQGRSRLSGESGDIRRCQAPKSMQRSSLIAECLRICLCGSVALSLRSVNCHRPPSTWTGARLSTTAHVWARNGPKWPDSPRSGLWRFSTVWRAQGARHRTAMPTYHPVDVQ